MVLSLPSHRIRRPTGFTDPTCRLPKLCDSKNRIKESKQNSERERERGRKSQWNLCEYKTWAQKTRTKVTQTRNLHLSRAFFTAAGNHNPTWMWRLWRLWRFVCSETTVAHHGHCSLEGPAPGVPAQTNWTIETEPEPPRNAMPKCDWYSKWLSALNVHVLLCVRLRSSL